MQEIKVEYDGSYPNLCSGHLSVTVEGRRWEFPRYCMRSGGQAWTRSDYTGTTHGDWSISDWPEGFPEGLKEAVLDAVNEQTRHGCCGGCI